MTNPFAEKHVVLGVTGSVAAYKAVELASKMTQSGALVDAVLTPAALHFVSALQFQSVTGRKATPMRIFGVERPTSFTSIWATVLICSLLLRLPLRPWPSWLTASATICSA